MAMEAGETAVGEEFKLALFTPNVYMYITFHFK